MNRLIPEIRRLASPTVMVGVCLFFILIPSLQNYLSIKTKPQVNLTLIEILEEELEEEMHKFCGDADLYHASEKTTPVLKSADHFHSYNSEDIPDIILSHTTPPPEVLC